MEYSDAIYGKTYYEEHLGTNYHDKTIWVPAFKRLAQHIVDNFHPKIVLDTGCAFGYLVKCLRELNVEAWGIDISNYAISQASEDIKQYLRVVSILDPLPPDFPASYDLILNIEVLEHLYENDAVAAIKNMTTYSDRIFFSSTSDDFIEPTHVNVRQQEYWAEKFAQFGYIKDLKYNTVSISKVAALYYKSEISIPCLVSKYETALKKEIQVRENEQATNGKLAQDIEMVRADKTRDEQWYRNEITRLSGELTTVRSDKSRDEQWFRNEIARLNGELTIIQTNKDHDEQCFQDEIACLKTQEAGFKTQLAAAEKQNDQLSNENNCLIDSLKANQQKLATTHNKLNELDRLLYEEKAASQKKGDLLRQVTAERNTFFAELERLKSELNMISVSRGYRLLQKWCHFRDWLLPKGSVRRRVIKHLANRILHKIPISDTNADIMKAIASATSEEPSEEGVHFFYTIEEINHQNWCHCHPIDSSAKFSILVPVYNTPQRILEEMIFSVKNQIYPNWELCIVDASPDRAEIRYTVEQLSADCSSKIKYLQLGSNGGIADNTQAALKIATGDFICLLDHDDLIAPNALYEYAACLEQEPDIDFFYSDKDMVNEEGNQRINPLLKPGYSPEIMFSANYMTHFCAIRRSVLDKTSGFDRNTDGAQDWDIFLKVMEQSNRFKRIEHILYHWRIISTSVSTGVDAKPYVLDAQLNALQSYIHRRGWPGKIYFQDREKSFLKVDWRFKEHPQIRAVIFSESGKRTLDVPGVVETVMVSEEPKALMEVAATEGADVLLFINGDLCTGLSANLAGELAAWALHPEIGFVAPQLRQEQTIASCGIVYDGDDLFDFFAGKPLGFYGQMGHSLWYRDFSGFRDACLAVERNKLNDLANVSRNSGLPLLTEASFHLLALGFRNVYDHYAWAEVAEKLPDINNLSHYFPQLREQLNLPPADVYFNHNCTLDVARIPNPSQLVAAAPVQIDQYSSDAFALASMFDFTAKDLRKNSAVVDTQFSGSVKTMVWFLQEFDYVFYAGLYTIFRTADYLRRKYGIQHTFAFITSLDKQVMLDRVGLGFPELAKCDAIQLTSPEELNRLKSYDASVCTLWTTAYYSLKFNRVKRKFYFIQDFEPLFYPGGSTYAQTEATYRFRFYGICNTQGLKQEYEQEYGGCAVALEPSVDTSVFHPDPGRNYEHKRYTVFFYGRPGHPRNGFELGVQAMKLVKVHMGDKVRIVTAGSNYDISAYGLDGVLENLGRLKMEETGDLYRSCDAGLVMMFTRHPSYLPYEMMACGCCVVSNYNEYTRWFLKDGENSVVCEASAGSIAEAIESVLLDGKRRKQIAENGARQIIENNPSWDESLDKVAQFIQNPKDGI